MAKSRKQTSARSWRRITVVASAACVLLGDAAVGADRRTSLDQAVSEARQRYDGRVISAETQRHNGRESHHIRILTNDGRVRRLRIDAGDPAPGRQSPGRYRD